MTKIQVLCAKYANVQVFTCGDRYRAVDERTSEQAMGWTVDEAVTELRRSQVAVLEPAA